MNTKGGLLVIGIDDKKNVLGIENDLNLLKKRDEDGFQLKITEIISNSIGKEFAQLVQCTFEEKENKKIALVHVKQSVDEPTYVTRNNEPKFFIRTNNSTQPLNMKESHQYIKKHWPGYF